MLTRREACERLKIGRDKLAQLIRDGELEAIKTGDARNSELRIIEASIDAYIERRRVVPAEQAS